jgi:DNA-binding CsgD family transcriptional regulator
LHATTAPLPQLPLIGRDADLAALLGRLDAAATGLGSALLLTGASGVGKSRLCRTLAEEAGRRGWQVAAGRAYPVEAGVPYALIADAFVPVLQRMEPETLAVLARGAEGELAQLFPGFGPFRGASDGSDAAEVKTRILWNFGQFLGRLAERRPLLLILEDLHWADASSLELVHFLTRQAAGHPLVLIGSYIDAERDANPALRALERSLVSAGQATVHVLHPLTLAETAELVERTFNVAPTVSREFSALLFGWTRGNPFFIQETLKALVESGRLQPKSGTWLGWEIGELSLPATVREAVAERLDRLRDGARRVAEVAAVIGTRVSYELLHAVWQDEASLLEALDELLRGQLLEEEESDDVAYDFTHPLIRETLYSGLARARRRALHTNVADALERLYGEAALTRPDELAYHYARGDAAQVGPKAVHYLAAAGRHALAREANREAAAYLQTALELSEAQAGAPERSLLEDLARARARTGDASTATALLERALTAARAAGDGSGEASVLRRMAMIAFWGGRYTAAIASYDEALSAAQRAGDRELRVTLLLAKAVSLQELGRPGEARAEIEAALAEAEALGSDLLLARAHRALALLYIWIGPPDLARRHGLLAIELAERCGEPTVAFAAHWAMAAQGGLTGDNAQATRHLADCDRIANESRSVRLRVATAEIAIEYANGNGRWDEALALGERTIALARSVGQRNLLPRVLVWTALIYLRRGELERGQAYVDEAWELSGAARAAVGQPVDVHSVVPAHIGRAVSHLVRGEFRDAIAVGEAGLEIADRSGYVVWAIHRLLPTIAECYVQSFDAEGARRVGARLRRDSERLGHRLGLAWADACDAFIAWLENDLEQAIELLRAAAEELEAVPFLPDAARIRRQLAARLRDAGQTEAAVRELRRVYDVFNRLGVTDELAKTREQLKELGSRPPIRGLAGVDALTGRELEIIRLAAALKSNKAIGKALGISPRTVSTHLSNIYKKLGIDSKTDLGEVVRKLELA